ncbi:hypothetical protein [Floridanema aerugineum]|uniref:Uncharacterized protein n=1 Tax=Floridaenema aerugineum BLCC-F46 TaxID=3153654 RepID=A0ABV4XEV9_9CYAN
MKNGTISLYTFHLARTFNDPLDRVSEEKAKIFGEELQTRLTQQISLNNELITRLLHDTYFTDLTFSSPDKIDLIPDEIDRFNPSQFLPQNIQNINAAIGETTSIGQTIFIYVKVAYKMEANQALADSYVRNFLKDTPYKNDKITASNESNLLGIPLFEYFCQTTAISNTQEPVCHILVLLNYHDRNGLKKLGDCYQDIVELLCSYHKVKFVYQQAQLSYQAALKVSQEIEKEIDNFVLYVADKNKSLNNLSEMLEKLPLLALKHSNYCGELEFSLTTIEINHQIYKNYLQKLLSEGSQLDSWQKFSDHTRDIFIKQIQFWLNYMSPRKELGQQLTASIQGIVEIEQVKSDRALELAEKERDRQLQQTLQENERKEKEKERNLQTTIAVVAVGIGFAGVAATASPYLIKQVPDQKLTLIPVHFQPSFGLNPPHNLTLSVLFSLGAGIVGVAIAARTMRYIQKHQKSPIARIVNFILGNSQAQ